METTIKILLRKDFPRKDGKSRIEFLIYLNGKQFRVSTGKNVEPGFWKPENESVDKKCFEASDINKYLSDKLSSFNDYCSKKKIMKEQINIEEIKAILKGNSLDSLEFDKKKKLPLIDDVFDKYIELNELKDGSINNLIMTKNVVKDFTLHHYKKIEPTIDIIDFNFLEKFKKYLRVERTKPNNQNTIAKRLKVFKSVIRYSIKLGNKINNPFEDYKIEHGKSREVALNRVEYERFYCTKLPSDACNSLKLSKDIFIFSCETGLRYSDVMDLKWDHIDVKISGLKKNQIKTELPVYVPLSDRARCLLIKYRHRNPNNKNVFPYIDNQVVNRYLKVLAILAEIDKNITSHVARHTFGTLAGASGEVSAFTLCKLMGHSDITMTQRYVNLSDKDMDDSMQKIWDKTKSKEVV